MKNIKIYCLASSENIDEIRYVGKTTQALNRRLSGHICDAKKSKLNNYTKNHNYNWINSVLEKDCEVIISELDSITIDDDENWEWLESYWINQMKTWGFNITNLTSGGDGNKNQHFTKETIEKRAMKIRGIPRDEETKRKISNSHKGKIKSEAHIEHIRETIVKKQGKPINQYTLEGNFIKEWSCIAEAARFYKIDQSSIARCCKGQFKKSAGFVWKFKNEDIV